MKEWTKQLTGGMIYRKNKKRHGLLRKPMRLVEEKTEKKGRLRGG